MDAMRLRSRTQSAARSDQAHGALSILEACAPSRFAFVFTRSSRHPVN